MNHATLTLQEFLEQLAAKQPTPGGGSASALGGAIGAALGSMAANYTLGNEKYQDFDATARAVSDALAELRGRLLTLMDDDIAAYQRYRDAVAMPKNSPDEKVKRSAALAAAREDSTAVPERLLSVACDGLQQVNELSHAVNPNLAGDVASSAYFLEACARGAVIQIFSNCAAPDDTGTNAARREAASRIVERCQKLREQIHITVLTLLKIQH